MIKLFRCPTVYIHRRDVTYDEHAFQETNWTAFCMISVVSPPYNFRKAEVEFQHETDCDSMVLSSGHRWDCNLNIPDGCDTVQSSYCDFFFFQLLVWRQQIAQEIVNHWSSGTCPLKVSQKVKLRWHVKFSFHPEISPKRQSTLSTFGLRVSCVFNHLFLFVWLVGRSKYAYIKLICGIQLHHWLVAWVFISL